jgi:ABC-2 type transport system ATP-binding protein
MLQLTAITKQYGKSGFVLQPISLQLDRGMHLLIGPNGAGKSTLLRIVAGVLRPDAGSIIYKGRKIASDLYRYKLDLGYLPQTFGFYIRMTGREFLTYMAGLKGIKHRLAQRRIDEVMGLLDLGAYCGIKIAGWSAGGRQRLGLAQALLNDPTVLIMDEPFGGLASQETALVRRLLTTLSRDKVILLSTHLIAGLTMNRLLLLANGYLEYGGTPETFLNMVQGKVWSVELAKDEWFRLQSRYSARAVIFNGARCRCKIISDVQPDLPGVAAVAPDLEDAYSYWLRCSNKQWGGWLHGN